jgi:hypothetical protein
MNVECLRESIKFLGGLNPPDFHIRIRPVRRRIVWHQLERLLPVQTLPQTLHCFGTNLKSNTVIVESLKFTYLYHQSIFHYADPRCWSAAFQ